METIELAGTVERMEGGRYVRRLPGVTSGGHPVVVFLAGKDDVTSAHQTYPHGYDSRCSWCYLGAGHSEAAHAQRTT